MPVFTLNESIETQMQRIIQLRQTNPDKAIEIMKNGMTLQSICQNGSKSKLQSVISQISSNEDILYYDVLQSYISCFVNNYLILADLFIVNGFNLHSIRHISLLNVIYENETVNDMNALNITKYLVSKGYDVNTQVSYLS